MSSLKEFRSRHLSMYSKMLEVIWAIWCKLDINVAIYNTGSLAYCSHVEDSDLDLAVVCPPGWSLDDLCSKLLEVFPGSGVKTVGKNRVVRAGRICGMEVDIQVRPVHEIYYIALGGYHAHTTFDIGEYNAMLKSREGASLADLKALKLVHYEKHMGFSLNSIPDTIDKNLDVFSRPESCVAFVRLLLKTFGVSVSTEMKIEDF